MTEDIFHPAAGADGLAEKTTPEERQELSDWLNLPDDQLRESVAQMSPEELVGRLTDARKVMAQQEARFTSMQEISSALGATIQIDELLVLIMDKITKLMDAERSSLFLIDEDTGELWSKVNQGMLDEEIRLQPGEGIAGWVAETGKSLNVSDVYRDPRFNPDTDAETGFRTESILAQCVRNQEGETIGVVEVLNSRNGSFSPADENLLSAIASQAAIAIENSKLYLSTLKANHELKQIKRQLEKKVAELDLLYDIEREISQAVDLEALVESITQKTLGLVDAQASALTLEESGHYRAYVLVDRQARDGGDGDGTAAGHDWDFAERKLSGDGGLSKRAMQRGEPVTCGSGACAPVPESVSRAMGLPVEDAVAVPLFDEDTSIGSLMVANRLPEDGDGNEKVQPGFSQDDVKVLTLIAGQIAGAVATRRHREEREKKERLAAVGQALSGVLHDLKNPAAIINGYVQLMVKADDRARREEFAESIGQQFDQFNQMTRELLVFARGENNVEFELVDVGEFMGKIKQLLDQELEAKGTELRIDMDCTGSIRLDPAKMKRALLNLARNAAESMDDGGVVTIRVTLESGDMLRFEVHDTGKGIPESIRETLYDSFVTEGKQHGTGLGLAIVKKAVEDQNGTVDFETEMGEGTTFYLRIPQTPRPPSSGAGTGQ